jgi:hypothetical protein
MTPLGVSGRWHRRMIVLHPSLDIAHLLGKPVPRDMTLGELKPYALTIPEVRAMGATRVRFVDLDGEELPDSMTLAAFQRLASAGKAVLSIDDSEGGLPVHA